MGGRPTSKTRKQSPNHGRIWVDDHHPKLVNKVQTMDEYGWTTNVQNP